MVPLTTKLRFIESHIQSKTGASWNVRLIGPANDSDIISVGGRNYVRSENNRVYSEEALKESVSLWDGVKVYDNHLTDDEFETRVGMRSPAKEWLGTIVEPRWNPQTHAIEATLKMVDRPTREKLVEAYNAGVLDTIGLSIDTLPKYGQVSIDGRPIESVEGFTKIVSADLVAEPAAGGRFLHCLENRIDRRTNSMPDPTLQVTPEFEEYLKGLIQEIVGGGPTPPEGGPPPAQEAGEGETTELDPVVLEDIAAFAKEEADKLTEADSASPQEVEELKSGLEEIVEQALATEEEEPSAMESMRLFRKRFRSREALDEDTKREIFAYLDETYPDHEGDQREMVVDIIEMFGPSDMEAETLVDQWRVGVPAFENVEEANALVAQVGEVLTTEPVTEVAPRLDSDGSILPVIETETSGVRRIENQLVLERMLNKAHLPEALESMVRDRCGRGRLGPQSMARVITRAKEAQISLDTSGRVGGLGGSRGGRGMRTPVRIGMTGPEAAEIEFLRLIAGNTSFRAMEQHQDEIVQERLPAAYTTWVKNGRPKYGTTRLSEWLRNVCGGNPLVDDRAREAISTADVSSIVKNTVNLMIAADYSVREKWWEPLVQIEEVDNIDDATLVRVYGLDQLSVVEEGQPYTELPWDDEEETATFHKRGNYVGVTLETMLNDKTNTIRSLPKRLSNSWYNTISTLVAAVFTSNSAAGPVLGDAGALFNATALTSAGGHANLLTSALSFSAFDAVATAMQKQTDQVLGAGQRLLIQPQYVLVPPDLKTTALTIRNTRELPGSANNDINPHFEGFEVCVVPNWTDTNNWAVVADHTQFPSIWLIFVTGNRAPTIFTADSEASGAMFTNDTLRFKVRMLTYRFSSTYDCAPVSDFRGLHKSNVV